MLPKSSDAARESDPAEGHGWRAVNVVLVGAFIALLDTTIVTVALPQIHSDLHASPAGLEWLVSAYALAYSLTLVTAGRAGDRFGHKRLFLIGLAVFTLASATCRLARTQTEIVVARAIQGIGAGLFYPAISATIQLSFTGPARSKAFGVLGATIGGSVAVGPVLGGLIIAAVGGNDGCRWIFLVNVFTARSTCLWPPGSCPCPVTDPPAIRPGRGHTAVGGVAPPAHSPHRGWAERLARVVLSLLRRMRGRVRAARSVGGAC